MDYYEAAAKSPRAAVAAGSSGGALKEVARARMRRRRYPVVGNHTQRPRPPVTKGTGPGADRRLRVLGYLGGF